MSGNRGPGQRSRGAGWEFVHVWVDDATRLAYVEMLTDEKASTAVAFLRRATSFYRSHGGSIPIRSSERHDPAGHRPPRRGGLGFKRRRRLVFTRRPQLIRARPWPLSQIDFLLGNQPVSEHRDH